MWPFDTIKKNYNENQINNVHQLAEDSIKLADFNGRIYIAFQGNPLLLLDEDLTAGEIFIKLTEIRDNFIDVKTKDLC